MIGRTLILPGDDPIRLAGRLLGDPSRWRELIDLNSLIAPYIAEVSSPGVLSPGDRIAYPLESGPLPLDLDQLETYTYKSDLGLDAGGDLVLEGSEPTLYAGRRNLQTALEIRLKHAVGCHPFHLDFGSIAHLHLGQTADLARLTLANFDLRKACLADPRIESVDLESVWEGEVLRVSVTVTPIAAGTPFVFDLSLTPFRPLG